MFVREVFGYKARLNFLVKRPCDAGLVGQVSLPYISGHNVIIEMWMTNKWYQKTVINSYIKMWEEQDLIQILKNY